MLAFSSDPSQIFITSFQFTFYWSAFDFYFDVVSNNQNKKSSFFTDIFQNCLPILTVSASQEDNIKRLSINIYTVGSQCKENGLSYNQCSG